MPECTSYKTFFKGWPDGLVVEFVMGVFTPFRGSSSPSTKNSMAFRRGNNLTASFASAVRLKLHDAKTFHVGHILVAPLFQSEAGRNLIQPQ